MMTGVDQGCFGRIRSRTYGGVGGVEPRGFPLSRSLAQSGPPDYWRSGKVQKLTKRMLQSEN